MRKQSKLSSRPRRQSLRLANPFPSWRVIRQWPARFQRIILATTADKNAWYLIVEVFWAAVLAGVATFNATFALRLGAQNSHIGLLSSLPALLAVAISIPAGRFILRRSRRKGWVLWSLFVHRLGYVVVAAVPWLPEDVTNRGAVLVYLLVTMSATATFFGVGWNSMLADVVPERRRASLFATRNIVSVCVTSMVTLLSGQWLEWLAFPANYQVLYALGFVSSLVSLYFLARVQVPESPVAAVASDAGKGLREQWRRVRIGIHEERAFVRITVNTLLFGIPAWTVGPLYILYYVRTLGASDSWIGLQGTVANVAAIAGYALGQRLITRWGESRTLKWAAPGAGLYPLLAGLVGSLTPILFCLGLDGLIVPSINLSHFSTLLRSCPEDRRPVFIGYYSTVMNVGAFLAPLLGVALADRIGPMPVLVACGILRILTGLMFTFWPVEGSEVVTAEPAPSMD